MSSVEDITIQKGATFIYPILIWNDNRVSRKNLTGFTANLKINRKLPNGDLEVTPIVELTTENGGITLGGAEGTIDLFISATDTAELPSINAFYNLSLINGSIVETALAGQAIIKETVTKC
jgi:hypothetical protein